MCNAWPVLGPFRRLQKRVMRSESFAEIAVELCSKRKMRRGVRGTTLVWLCAATGRVRRISARAKKEMSFHSRDSLVIGRLAALESIMTTPKKRYRPFSG